MNLASILLILTGMQWYLLFNLLAGINQIPADLKEAARSFGLPVARGASLSPGHHAVAAHRQHHRVGRWMERADSLRILRLHGATHQVLGLGAMLDAATYKTSNGVMILLSLLSMIAVVLTLESSHVAPLVQPGDGALQAGLLTHVRLALT